MAIGNILSCLIPLIQNRIYDAKDILLPGLDVYNTSLLGFFVTSMPVALSI